MLNMPVVEYGMTDNINDEINTVSPQERVKALMMKFIKRKQNISPTQSDGFLTTGTLSDSESSGTDNNN